MSTVDDERKARVRKKEVGDTRDTMPSTCQERQLRINRCAAQILWAVLCKSLITVPLVVYHCYSESRILFSFVVPKSPSGRLFKYALAR